MSIDISKITKIYMGRDRTCRCGCAGEYLEPNDKLFSKRVKRFMAMAATYNFEEHVTDQGFLDKGPNYMNISYGQDRALTIYFD